VRSGAPVVCVGKAGNALRLSAVDPQALELGLSVGLPLADARARVADLAAVDADPHADQDWLERLCDGAERYTPLAALDAPHGLMLDVTGCAHLLGGEAGLAGDAVARLERGGITVRHAFAATPEAAHALARYQTAPAADEDGAVRRLPVAALRLEAESETALRRAGLRTVGDVAQRPPATIAARFGAEAVDTLHRMLGLGARPLDPRRALPAVMVERRFPEPVARTAYALDVLAALMEEAGARLAERGQGGRRFHAVFFRSDGVAFPLRVETGLPTRDAGAVMRLMGERIDSLSNPIDPGFGFDMVRLSVPRAERLAPGQLDLGEGKHSARPQEADMAGLIDMLGTRVGRHRIQRLVPQDSHIPEQAQLALPAVTCASPAPWPAPPPGEPPLRPLHLFDPPQRIDVIAQVPDGPPHRFRWRRRQHDVRLFEGPERIAPEWWKAADGAIDSAAGTLPHTRDYYRVEDARGRRFWLFRDGLYGVEAANPQWFMHGLFA
jgi:protein ImuB